MEECLADIWTVVPMNPMPTSADGDTWGRARNRIARGPHLKTPVVEITDIKHDVVHIGTCPRVIVLSGTNQGLR